MTTIDNITQLSYYHGIKVALSCIKETLEDPQNEELLSIDFVKAIIDHNIGHADSKLLELERKGVSIDKGQISIEV